MLGGAAHGGKPTTGMTWDKAWDYRLLGMDTPEPPDGGRHAYNSTPCAWNDEDDVGIRGSGSLAPGETADVPLCLIADLYNNPFDYPKFIYARVYAPKAVLAVSASISPSPAILPDGRAITNDIQAHAPFRIGTQQEYTLCGADAVAIAGGVNGWNGLTYWPMVPGSGGYGQRVDYTLHITNTSRNTTKVSAFYSIAWDDYDATGPFIAPTIQVINGAEPRIDCPPRP